MVQSTQLKKNMGTLFLALKINSIFQDVKKYTAKVLRLTINYIIYI